MSFCQNESCKVLRLSNLLLSKYLRNKLIIIVNNTKNWCYFFASSEVCDYIGVLAPWKNTRMSTSSKDDPRIKAHPRLVDERSILVEPHYHLSSVMYHAQRICQARSCHRMSQVYRSDPDTFVVNLLFDHYLFSG